MSLFFPLTLFGQGLPGEGDEILCVGAVQYSLSPEIYLSSEKFINTINQILDNLEEQALTKESPYPLDLVVFPEYTSALFGLGHLSVQAREELFSLNQPLFQNDDVIRAINLGSIQTQKIWERIALEREYPILAGSTLTIDSAGRIRNQALLFHPQKGLIWTQDKSFPGAPETRILNLAVASPEQATPFTIDDKRIVLTICRDTYNTIWESIFPPAFLWIDIKANELPKDLAKYPEALSARLSHSPIPYGLTVSLIGKLANFHFQGPLEFISPEETLQFGDFYSTNDGSLDTWSLIVQIPKTNSLQ